jgi:hypothetical protein
MQALVFCATLFTFMFQQGEATTITVSGQVMRAIGDFTQPDPTGVEIPAANRQVLIFRGPYKEFKPNDIPYQIVKTNKHGKFELRLEPGIYTIAIVIGRDIVPSGRRPDGYFEFFDLVKEKTISVSLIDRSQAIYSLEGEEE